MKYFIFFLILSQVFFVQGISFNKIKDAVKGGAVTALNTFLDNGASPNMVGPRCYKSLLMWAAISGATDTARVLLDRGADPNLTEKNTRMTALMYATERNNVDVAKLLMQYNADKNMRNSKGKSAMDIAKEKHFQNMVEIF